MALYKIDYCSFFQDEGINGQFIYVLRDPSESFHLDPASGKLKMKNSANFDREKFEKFELEVSTLEVKPSLVKKSEEEEETEEHSDTVFVGGRRSQSQGKKSKIKILINVDDDNDNSPVFLPSKF